MSFGNSLPDRLPLSEEQKKDILFAVNNRFGGIRFPNTKEDVWRWIQTGERRVEKSDGSTYLIFDNDDVLKANGVRHLIGNIYAFVIRTLYHSEKYDGEIKEDFSQRYDAKNLDLIPYMYIDFPGKSQKQGPSLTQEPTFEEVTLFRDEIVRKLIQKES